MSTTHLGITCKLGDAMPVLNINTKYGIKFVKKNQSVDNFDLFTVTINDLPEQVVNGVINSFASLDWKYPDSCTLIVESPYPALNGVTIPNNSTVVNNYN